MSFPFNIACNNDNENQTDFPRQQQQQHQQHQQQLHDGGGRRGKDDRNSKSWTNQDVSNRNEISLKNSIDDIPTPPKRAGAKFKTYGRKNKKKRPHSRGKPITPGGSLSHYHSSHLDEAIENQSRNKNHQVYNVASSLSKRTKDRAEKRRKILKEGDEERQFISKQSSARNNSHAAVKRRPDEKQQYTRQNCSNSSSSSRIISNSRIYEGSGGVASVLESASTQRRSNFDATEFEKDFDFSFSENTSTRIPKKNHQPNGYYIKKQSSTSSIPSTAPMKKQSENNDVIDLIGDDTDTDNDNDDENDTTNNNKHENDDKNYSNGSTRSKDNSSNDDNDDITRNNDDKKQIAQDQNVINYDEEVETKKMSKLSLEPLPSSSSSLLMKKTKKLQQQDLPSIPPALISKPSPLSIQFSKRNNHHGNLTRPKNNIDCNDQEEKTQRPKNNIDCNDQEEKTQQLRYNRNHNLDDDDDDIIVNDNIQRGKNHAATSSTCHDDGGDNNLINTEKKNQNNENNENNENTSNFMPIHLSQSSITSLSLQTQPDDDDVNDTNSQQESRQHEKGWEISDRTCAATSIQAQNDDYNSFDSISNEHGGNPVVNELNSNDSSPKLSNKKSKRKDAFEESFIGPLMSGEKKKKKKKRKSTTNYSFTEDSYENSNNGLDILECLNVLENERFTPDRHQKRTTNRQEYTPLQELGSVSTRTSSASPMKKFGEVIGDNVKRLFGLTKHNNRKCALRFFDQILMLLSFHSCIFIYSPFSFRLGGKEPYDDIESVSSKELASRKEKNNKRNPTRRGYDSDYSPSEPSSTKSQRKRLMKMKDVLRDNPYSSPIDRSRCKTRSVTKKKKENEVIEIDDDGDGDEDSSVFEEIPLFDEEKANVCKHRCDLALFYVVSLRD